ncbi:hypothetical protein KCU92_g9502, partial [Aureobasidium melanogenum]
MRHTASEEVSNSRPKRVTARPNYVEVQEGDEAYSEVQEDDELADSTQESRLQPAKKRARMAKSRKNETSNDEVSLPQQPPLKSSRVNAKGKGSKRVVSADTEVLEQPSEPRRSSRRSSKRTYRDESSDEEPVPSVQSDRKKLSAKAKGKQKVVDDPVEEQEYVDDGEVVDGTESDFEFDDEEEEEDIALEDVSETYLPGPDVEEEVLDDDEDVDEDKVWMPVVYPTPCIDLEADEVIAAFSDLTRRTMKLLQEEAQWFSDFIVDLDYTERPMTLPVWHLLLKMDIEDRVQLFCATTPREVQEATLKIDWVGEDWIELPDDPEDFECPGIYGDFATGNIRHQNDMDADSYVGSTCRLRRRKHEHRDIARKYREDDLPEKFDSSRHYHQICRDGVVTNFRVLNTFPEGVEVAWLTIFEGIWQLWLHSMREITTYSRYRSITCLEMYERIRDQLDLPEVSWRGMNAAWTLQQGWQHPGSKFKSPCQNPACGDMTYPRSGRSFFDKINPSAGYVCPNCQNWRRRHGNLPDEDTLVVIRAKRRMAKLNKAMREEAGPNAKCWNCGVYEFQLCPTKMGPGVLRTHEHDREHLFCPGCYNNMVLGVEMPQSPEDAKMHALKFLRHFAKMCGWVLACDHCGTQDNMEKGHMRTDGMLICPACYDSIRNNGQLMDLAYVRERELRKIADPINKAAVARLVAQNQTVPCSYPPCTRDGVDTTKRVTYTSIGIMHHQCGTKWRNANGLKSNGWVYRAAELS